MVMNKYLAASRESQARRRRWRGCERKVGFPTADAAWQPGNDIYKCQWCGQWHRTGAAAAWAAKLEAKFGKAVR